MLNNSSWNYEAECVNVIKGRDDSCYYDKKIMRRNERMQRVKAAHDERHRCQI